MQLARLLLAAGAVVALAVVGFASPASAERICVTEDTACVVLRERIGNLYCFVRTSNPGTVSLICEDEEGGICPAGAAPCARLGQAWENCLVYVLPTRPMGYVGLICT